MECAFACAPVASDAAGARYDQGMNRLLDLLRRPFRRPAPSAPQVSIESINATCRQLAPVYGLLPKGDREDLAPLIQTFLSTKRYWASGDFVLTLEMKIVIAAYACLLVLRLPEFGLYPRTAEIIVYPGCFGEETEAIGPDGARYTVREHLAGRAIPRGPVLLALDMIELGLRGARGNVIVHEFAHALDFLDGVVDGTPPLAGNAQVTSWSGVFTREFERLRLESSEGRPTLLDPYGGLNPAEFFAVASECFFSRPIELRARHMELYQQLAEFYRQDPAEWAR